MNALTYAAIEQNKFNQTMAEFGHKAFTTFFGDLSIAEYVGGEDGVKDTYRNVVASWGNDIEYFTEFVIALNHKIWEHYEKKPKLAEVYDNLWRKAQQLVEKNFKDDKDALAYYYRETD